MAFALGEQGDQGVCPRHFFAARALNMDNCALNDAVETRRWARFFKFFDDKAL